MCEVISHVVLICISLMTSDFDHFFICLAGHLYVLFGELSIQVLCLCFSWIVCLPGVELYKFFIYFGKQPLLDVSLANMFSHTV